MYLFQETVASTNSAKTVSALNPPKKATGVEIQADTQAVRYTMDGVTVPTSFAGMLFNLTDPPKFFVIEDLKNIQFIQGSGGAGNLNFHYLAGRNI